jgi:hypothetical protein
VVLREAPLREDRDGPLAVACFSVSMLLHEHGKQFTRSELGAMLSAAGFVDVDAVPSHGIYELISARRP